LSNKTSKVSSDQLKDKLVAIYFSAHWCPPCRAFTPQLAHVYKALQEKGKPFEIIFVSSDQDQEAFNEYFGKLSSKRKVTRRLQYHIDQFLQYTEKIC